MIALAEGRPAEAVERLRTAAEQHPCTICVLPDLARAYEADGKGRAATTVYERYVTTPWFWRYETDALELGPALERLAALYDAVGEREKAQGRTHAPGAALASGGRGAAAGRRAGAWRCGSGCAELVHRHVMPPSAA